MKLYIILFLLSFNVLCHSQDKTYLLSDKYNEDQLIEFSVFDSTNNWFDLYSISQFNDTMLVQRIDTNGYSSVDTTFGYHQNGKVAFYRIYFQGMNHGNFRTYDTLGNLDFSGQYYKGIRVGTWRAFNSKGKVVENTEYIFSFQDSVFIESNLDSLTSKTILKNNIVYDTLSFFYITNDQNVQPEYSMNGSYGLIIIHASVAFVKSFKRKKKGRSEFNRRLYDSGIKPE